ncbi:MAG: hypothetical protein WBB18_10750 [Nodosilinea sp.]
MQPRPGAGSLPDRVGAALEAVVISDRWVVARQSGAETQPGWQRGLLQVSHACIQGDSLRSQRWQTHFQTLPDTAAVLLNALPYLWLQADAHRHHRAAVAGWATGLGRSPATTAACEALFDLICQGMTLENKPGPASVSLVPPASASANVHLLESARQLVAQSQGEFAIVLGRAHRLGWAAAEVALAGLLVGLTGGRAAVGAHLRQRWLEYHDDAGQDGWTGLSSYDLESIALGLHHRWAGGGAGDRTEHSPFPLGVKV